jgi:predicted transcriptional regulator
MKDVVQKKSKRKRRPNMSMAEVAEALIKSGGFQSRAAEMLGTTTSAVHMRIARSPELQNLVREIKDKYVDIAEIQLLKNIKSGDTTSIIFYLKCQAKERGYVDRQEVHAQLSLSHDDWIDKLDEPQ